MPDLIPLDHRKPGSKAKQFEEFMSSGIVGQGRALRYFARVMELHTAGTRDPRRPIYSVLLAGPSGVGKTMTAEMLAEFLFQDPTGLTKIACAEYSMSHDISALIGSPPGYVGFWNPDDPMSGAEPILSQFNIDRFDYFKQLSQAGDSGIEATANRLNELITRHGALLEILYQLGMEGIKQSGKKDKKDKDDILLNEEDIPGGKRYKLDPKKNAAMRQIIEELVKIESEIPNLKQKARKAKQYSPKDNYRSVILFDEIEKANDALHKLLLEIMDKGQVRMKNGVTTRFTNSFVVMTSNVGSDQIDKILNQRGYGFRSETEAAAVTAKDQNIYDAVMNSLAKVFPPEFRGRLDNVIVFRPLEKKHLSKILDLEIEKLRSRLLKIDFPVILNIGEEVKEFLLEKSLKRAEEGARLLRKRVEKYLEENLCRMKNSGELVKADIVHVVIMEENGEKKVRFSREARPNETSEASA